MRPWQIVLLVAAGAAGGAVIMNLMQRPAPVAERRAMAKVEPVQTPAAPASAPAPAAEPVPVAPPVQPEAASHQSPFEPQREVTREAPRPRRVHPSAISDHVSRVAVAQNSPNPPATLTAPPSVPVAAAPAPAPAPAAEPTKETQVSEPSPPARPEPENATPPPAPEPHRVTLNAGTLISVRLVEGLSSERNAPGDTFVATLDKELVADGFVIAERGARVEGRVVASDRGGRTSGVASLVVELTMVHTSDGQNMAVRTDPFQRRAQETHRQDAEKVGAGAAVGAVVGAIGGGGKGAAIGAGVGGAIGAGTVLLTRGDPARLPTETRISFRLRSPVTLTERL